MKNWNFIRDKYIDNLKIFPIKENSKLPLIPKWQLECSSDFFQIAYWINNSKNCNWALPANENNLFILDLDVHDDNKNGIVNFNKLCEDIGLNENPYHTLVQQTPSGGRHLIYKSDDDLKEIANTSQSFSNYPGIDIRTTGYVVVEPSIINGNKYVFLNDFYPQPMPKKLKEFILNNSDKKRKEHTPYIKPKEVLVGNRDDSLFGYVNNLYYKTDLDYDEILLLATHFNESFDEPLSEKDVLYKVKKAFEKPRGNRIILRFGDEETSEDL
jgi:hypothetical protein